MKEVIIGAYRGRGIDNSQKNCVSNYEQRFEIRGGVSNTLTSVQKDNIVVEIESYALKYERNEYGKQIRRAYETGQTSSKIREMKDLVPREDGISNTITTILKDNYVMEKVLMPEPIEARPKGKGWHWVPEERCWLRIRKLTPRECFRLMDIDEKNIGKIQNARFDKDSDVPVAEPTEISVGISNSQQYKLAGNSIVVACLEGIFRNLFFKENYESDLLF